MSYSSAYWNKKIASYLDESWSREPSPFVKKVSKYLSPNSTLVELGSGAGQDGLWLAAQGHKVVLTDATSNYFDHIKEQVKQLPVELTQLDVTKRLPFADSCIDAVYAHLVLHYFNDEEMIKIITEIERVLKPGGILACMVNTQSDEEYDTQKADSQDIMHVNGITKRFFTVETLRPFVQGFEPLLFDNKGQTPKDDAVGNSGMIEFIGKLHV